MATKETKSNSTHIPVLIKLLSKTTGDVLEIGTGVYSTPLLHWLCYENDRKLLSLESSDEYIEYAKQFEDTFHAVKKVNDYGEFQDDRQWGVVFIDHFPLEDREIQLKKYISNAQYVVVHDSTSEDFMDISKHRADFNAVVPNTGIFSNFNVIEL